MTKDRFLSKELREISKTDCDGLGMEYKAEGPRARGRPKRT